MHVFTVMLNNEFFNTQPSSDLLCNIFYFFFIFLFLHLNICRYLYFIYIILFTCLLLNVLKRSPEMPGSRKHQLQRREQ